MKCFTERKYVGFVWEQETAEEDRTAVIVGGFPVLMIVPLWTTI